MPIIVKDITWNQTEENVSVQVPLHGVPTSAVDIFTSDNYFKASFESFFYECFPYDSVNTDKSIATILSTKIVFNLQKLSPGIWPELERALTKPQKKDVKSKAILDTQTKLTKEQEEKRNQKAQRKRDAVSMAVEQDAKTRREIEAIKEREKIEALGNLEELKIDTRQVNLKKSKVPNKRVYQQSVVQKEEPPVPLPRNCNGRKVIEVEFTPRELPTPSRESTQTEECEWLQKQAQARRAAGFASEDLRPEEKSPDYILYQGKQFLKCANYLGAISAFTFGIELSPKLVDFYIFRSQAHFAIGNHHKCVQDCSTALEIMKPEVYANLSQRVECIHRRGMALFKLGLRREAAGEVRAAINLQPSSQLTRDLYEILDSPEFVEKENAALGLKEIDH